jgi:UDP-N-acetylglucosamine 2-epimerase (non-hydrolysing)
VKKILNIFGTRPEAIKMAPLIKEMSKSEMLVSRVCVTGQHKEMLDQVLELFEINPEYNLDVMEPGQSLAALTASMLSKLEYVYNDFKPDLVLVHGDTSSTLAGCLSAYYEKVPVGHVEAGLRTGNLDRPWPEEGNRKIVGAISRLHFAPTSAAAQNLSDEGVSKKSIHITGNTVIDALLWTKNKIKTDIILQAQLSKEFPMIQSKRKMILVTTHRRENFGNGLKNICQAIREIALAHPETDIVLPVHLNPEVSQTVLKLLTNIKNVYLIKPQEYCRFVFLMMNAYIIITDSGGLQEEAPALGKPVLVMRNETEREEALVAGTAKLVGTEVMDIIHSSNLLLKNSYSYDEMAFATNPYGDGTASRKIVKILEAHFGVPILRETS